MTRRMKGRNSHKRRRRRRRRRRREERGNTTHSKSLIEPSSHPNASLVLAGVMAIHQIGPP